VKALSRKTQEQKERDRVDKYITDNYEEVIYESVSMSAGYIVKQTAAEFLKALSLYGFGTKRLNDVYEKFLGIANLPGKIMNQQVHADAAIEAMEKMHKIDFDRINVNYQSYEDFCKERAANAKK